MIGLALQGGGARGAYQVGAYYAFLESHLKFDAVAGTSIGAFNGALIACGKEKELLDFWTSVSIGELLGFDKEYVRKKIAKEYDFTYLKLSLKNMFAVLKSKGIKIDGLEKVLNDYLDEEKLLKSKMDFGICTVRLNDLKPLYIFKKDMAKSKIKDYILASCYLPIFHLEKKVDDHYYLDGGFYDNTPINMLIERGCKKVYVVELNPLLNISKKPSKPIEIIRITPKRSLGGVLIYDSKSLIENIKMGYYDALRVVKKLDGEYYCFKRRPNFYYNFLIRKVRLKELKHLKGFFHAKTNKELIIRALEYWMKNENVDYYQVYSPYKIIKEIKKAKENKNFVDKFLTQLKFL